jgi:hypothetical protein
VKRGTPACDATGGLLLTCALDVEHAGQHHDAISGIWWQADEEHSRDAKSAKRPPCSIESCEEPNHARGLCRRHYYEIACGRGRTISPAAPPRPTRSVSEESFWAQVTRTDDPDACWVWTGAVNADGYGQTTCPWRPGGVGAHRAAYYFAHKVVPEMGLHIDHLCRNHPCVNPRHLELVTPRENVMRGDGHAARLAARTHCDKGHPFSGDNLAIRKDGSRKCRACHAKYMREWAGSQ